MKTTSITIQIKATGRTVTYHNVIDIDFSRADALYSAADIAGNGIKPSTIVLVVRMDDGEEATFSAVNVRIIPQ